MSSAVSIFRPQAADDEWTPIQPDAEPWRWAPRRVASLTVSDFFETWYVPYFLLDAGLFRAKPATKHQVTKVRDAVKRWRDITGDPQIGRISNERLKEYRFEQLPKAVWSRSKAEKRVLRTLSEQTRYDDLRSLDQVLSRLGQPQNAQDRRLGVFLLAPTFGRVPKPDPDPSRPIPLEHARKIAEEAGKFRWPPRRKGGPARPKMPGNLWACLVVGAAYYLGIRRRTILSLRWTGLSQEPDWRVLSIRAGDKKDGKRTELSIHPQLDQLLSAAQRFAQDDRIVPWDGNDGALSDFHVKLAAAAGVEYTLHDWRRTHRQQMERQGAGKGEKLAQEALEHSDLSITSTYYGSETNWYRQRLPLLWPDGLPEFSAVGEQLELFANA
jgi:integrase